MKAHQQMKKDRIMNLESLKSLSATHDELCQHFASGDGSGKVIELRAGYNDPVTGHPKSFLVVAFEEGEVVCGGLYSDASDASRSFAQYVQDEAISYFDSKLTTEGKTMKQAQKTVAVIVVDCDDENVTLTVPCPDTGRDTDANRVDVDDFTMPVSLFQHLTGDFDDPVLDKTYALPSFA